MQSRILPIHQWEDAIQIPKTLPLTGARIALLPCSQFVTEGATGMKFDLAPIWMRLQGMINSFLVLVPNLILAVILLALFLLLAKWARALLHRFMRLRGHQTNVGILIGRLSTALIYLIGLLLSLSVLLPSFKAVDLIQVLGVGSVAIGFAFRDVLQNFLAGILILLAQPFRIGEEISVDGKEGVVEEIQARATLLRTFDGFLVVIPNTTIYTQTITIYNAYEKRRTVVDFTIGRESDAAQAVALIRDTLRGIPGIMSDPPPNSIITKVTERGTVIQARWWTDTKQTDYQAVTSQAIPAIKRVLAEHHIDLPYPIQQVITKAPTAQPEPATTEAVTEASARKGAV
jgi:small conductance mechanosensitive channel